VRRVREGETALFEVLMRRHNPRVYRAVRSIVRSESDAEDAMQQAYLSAFTHLDQQQGPRFAPWLLRIAVNVALARTRDRQRLVVMEEPPEPGEAQRAAPATPEERVMHGELGRLLEAALDEIPEIYAATFVLREVEGLPTAETAEALGVSEEVVKTRMHRARALLQDRLYASVGAAARDVFRFDAPRCDRVVAAVLAQLAAP